MEKRGFPDGQRNKKNYAGWLHGLKSGSGFTLRDGWYYSFLDGIAG